MVFEDRYKAEPICMITNPSLVHSYEILAKIPQLDWVAHDKRLLNESPNVASCVGTDISINLSTRSIISLTDLEVMRAATKTPGLILEWVESRDDEEIIREAAAKLMLWRKEFGVRLSLDDMGTGQDCFQRYLLIGGADIGKINGAILHGARSNEKSYNALVYICEWLRIDGVPSIVEWIENEVDMEIALSANATYGQGYYFTNNMTKIFDGRLAHI